MPRKATTIDESQFAEWDKNRERRESLVRRMCAVMGWPYKAGPFWSGARQAAIGNATFISNDKLEEIIERLGG